MEIISNVHLVPRLRGANVYLLLGETLTLVDTGMPGSEGAILNYISGLDRSPDDLARIVVTHHHLDHVGSLAALKKRTSAKVLAHPADALFISGDQSPPQARGVMRRLLLGLLGPVLPHAELVVVDQTVRDRDSLDLLGGATVIHVPGHTPGAIALYFPVERLLICGDAIDGRRNQMAPPPKAFTADADQARASLRRLAELDFDVLCPGHGTPIAGGADNQVRTMVRALG